MHWLYLGGKKNWRVLNVTDSECIHFNKEPKESGHSLQPLMRTGKRTREMCFGRERENVAGDQPEGENEGGW